MNRRAALLLGMGLAATPALPLASQPGSQGTPRTITMPVRPIVPSREMRPAQPNPPGNQFLNVPGDLLTWAVINASNPLHRAGTGWVRMSVLNLEAYVAHPGGSGVIRMPPSGPYSFVKFELRPHTTPVVYSVRCLLELFTQPGQASGEGTITLEFPVNVEQTWTTPVSDNTDNEVTIDFFLNYPELPNYATAFEMRATHEWELRGCRFQVV